MKHLFLKSKILLFAIFTLTTTYQLKAQGSPLVSAFFGLDNAMPLQANFLCPGALGMDGMPVNFKYPIDATTLSVESEIHYIQTFDNQRYPVFKTMSEIESSIDPSLFFRINRQVLLNKNAIKEVQPYFNRKVIIKTDVRIKEQLIVSRLKVTEFMNWIEQS